MDLSIAKMAKSSFRCATYGSDIEAFTAAHNGSLAGTMHCARYLGKRVFIDGVTKEVIDSEGVVLSGMEHLIEEFDKLIELLSEKMQGPFYADGVLIPVQKGNPHFRIYDMYAPEAESPFTLWTQINTLADAFMLLDKQTMYMRPVQYFHSRSFSTQKAYDREAQRTVEAVERSTAQAHRSGELLGSILSYANDSADQVRVIATAAEEQSAAAEEVSRATEEINKISFETSQAMVQSTSAVTELASLAERLNSLISEMR